jgi:CheY-like chemotaxis protein
MKLILLIEDDDITRIYLSEALKGPDTNVITCIDFAQAIALCNSHFFDLIVSDIQLGNDTLFDKHMDLPSDVPILATSADLSTLTRTRLMQIGIDNHLAKPAAIVEIQYAVNRILWLDDDADHVLLWNETRALNALGGNAETLIRLKNLFKEELPAMDEQIKRALAAGEMDKVRAILHKLKASCGFLGATRLLHYCHALDSEPSMKLYEPFNQALKDTLATL